MKRIFDLSRGRRRAARGKAPRTVGAVIASVSLLAFLVVPAQAALNRTEFELDKDAQNNVTTDLLGTLRANTNSSVTSFEVCQKSSTNPTTPITILVDAERMTVGTIANASGGGCSGAFKRLYTVTRGADGTTAAAHSGGEDITLLDLSTVAGDDWDDVYAQITADTNDEGNDDRCIALDAVECAYISDPKGVSIFTTGGSKDDLDIPSWRWTDGSVPDSDEILDAFAAKYFIGGEENLYFGADRFAVNGAKDMGFWFFHLPVVDLPDGTFDGTHSVPDPGANGIFCNEAGNTDDPICSPRDDDDVSGDILILSTFTQGGATTTVRIFEWVGEGGNATANGTVNGPVGTFGDCVPGAGGQNGCATVNDTTVESPWLYLGKGESASDQIPSGGLLEGGVNLTDLGLDGCFASFLAETRSAPSVDAQLKDFVLGDFERCAADVTTTPADGEGTALTDGPDQDDPALPDIQIGTGADGVDVTDLAVVDVQGTSTWDGTLDFYICGPIASGTCDTGGVKIGATLNIDETTTQPIESAAAHLTQVGRYCWRGDFTSGTQGVPSDVDSSEGECFQVLPVTPTLTTTAVEATVGLSPTIFGSMADVNGDGAADGGDDSSAFYGDTSIIDGGLDCDAWATDNDGAQGDGTIDSNDDCVLIGVDGTPDGVEIEVIDGAFATADGDPIADGTALPTVFNAATPGNPDVGDSDFAWSTNYGRVDSNGDETIDGEDCHFGLVGDADVLGDDAGCGFGTPPPSALNGHIDLNGDGTVTDADSCDDGCIFGHDVFNGFVQAGGVPFGEPLYDVATLTGTANEPGTNGGSDPGGQNNTFPSINATNQASFPADGTLTFTLVGPDIPDDPDTPEDEAQTVCDPEVPASGGETGEENPEDVTVEGDAQYITLGFTPGSPGDYHWLASYDGSTSGNTLGTSHNDACDEAGEDVTVLQLQPTMNTAQDFIPNDSATVTVDAGAGDLDGNVIFYLWVEDATCGGGDLGTADQTFDDTDDDGFAVLAADAGADPLTDTVSTDNTTAYDLGDDADDDDDLEFYWIVVFTSNNNAHLDVVGACGNENASIAIDNGDTEPLST